MNMRIGRIGMLVVGFCVAGIASAEPTIEDVTKQISEASKKLKSFSAKAKMVTEMKQEGFSMTSTAESTTEMLRKGEDFLMRNEGTNVSETDIGGTKNKQESTTLTITDAEYTYAVSDTGGVKSAYKMKMQKNNDDPFQAWRETADIKVMPEGSVDGRAVWVIEASPKAEQAAHQGKSLLYFDKESGQMIKMVVNGPDGKPMSTMTYSDIKINPSIGEDRFVFKAPEGVEVQDMSN